MGKGSSKAPGYKSATYDTGGLFGSSTAGKKGVTYNPTGWMNSTMGTVGGNLNNTLQSMINNDFTTDPNFQAYQNQFNRQMNDYYDNNVLNNLANRGLMRSSGLQAANNAFANTLADKQLDVYDNYYNRLNNNLANMLNTSNTLYNYMTGVNSGAQTQANNVNNYNLSKTQTDNAAKANNNALMGTLASSVAGIATSDERVKQNIKKIGEKNGFNWYEFEYKDGYGLPVGKHEGVIAQEVEKVIPEAVTEVNGIKQVDYNKLGLESEVK
jgi:hypothetical protein